MRGKCLLTEDERREFFNFRQAHPELNFNQARYRFYKQVGKLEYTYKSHNSRVTGYKPEFFTDVQVIRDTGSIYSWAVFDNGKFKRILTPKETSSTKTHLYAYVTSTDGICRIMSLASLVWLCYLHKEIPAGYVIDHIDEDPMNNDPGNLQCITIGENVRRSKCNKNN